MTTLVQEDALVEKIRSELPEVVAVYLFGSAATGELRPDSDLDLAILPGRDVSATQLFSVAQSLAVLAGRDLDLVSLQSASTVMRAQIISTGKQLFCADQSVCSEFEDRVFSEYARLNEERRDILEDINSRGQVYGR